MLISKSVFSHILKTAQVEPKDISRVVGTYKKMSMAKKGMRGGILFSMNDGSNVYVKFGINFLNSGEIKNIIASKTTLRSAPTLATLEPVRQFEIAHLWMPAPLDLNAHLKSLVSPSIVNDPNNFQGARPFGGCSL